MAGGNTEDLDLEDIVRSVSEQNQYSDDDDIAPQERDEINSEMDAQQSAYLEQLKKNRDSIAPGSSALKVLVVDDSSVARATIARHLQEHEVMVDQADSGQQAIEAMGHFSDYDLITLDQNMAGLSGIQTFELIRQHEVPVVMVSTEAEKDTIVNALMKGLSNYVIKPFTREEFLERSITP